jgi:hypothetical protein
MNQLRDLTLKVACTDDFLSVRDTEIGEISVQRWGIGSYDPDGEGAISHGPTSCYHTKPSSLTSRIYVTIRREYPGGWEYDSLNDFDDGRDDLSDREVAATFLHEVAHHMIKRETEDVGQFENELLAWARARTLWSRMDLDDTLGGFPSGRAADCLTNYHNNAE